MTTPKAKDPLELLHEQAKEKVALEFDAWANLSGAQREAEIYKAMLQILEEQGQGIFKNILMVARAAWEDRAWANNGAESFVEFLCDVGGRYKQDDGKPSGTAYDLAGYVTIAWPLLEELGQNPIEVATQSWSKARLIVSPARESALYLTAGQPVERPEQATDIVLRPESAERMRDVVRQAVDKTIHVRDMMDAVCQRRVPPFRVDMILDSQGMWTIAATNLTEQQMNLISRLLERHAEFHFT